METNSSMWEGLFQPLSSERIGLPPYVSSTVEIPLQVSSSLSREGWDTGVLEWNWKGEPKPHVAKLESEIGGLNKLLVTRTLGLKKLGIPCKHRKLILKFTHKYRLGLWQPRMNAPKA